MPCYAIWQQFFGGSASAIGRTLTLNANAFVIVGVAPATFTGARVDQSPDLRSVAVGGSAADVVGIARNAKYASVDEAPAPFIYMPWRPGAAPGTLHVRVSRDAGAVIPAVRGRIAAIDPTVVVFDVKTVEQHLDAVMSPLRLASSTLGFFAVIGLTLAVVGLYSVTAYALAMRTREIGIRIALGATRRSVSGLVALDSARLVGVGAGAGLAAAFVATRALQSLMYGAQAMQMSVGAASALLLIASAAAATCITVRRAVRIEPTVALRSE